jgi:hypothetical protein
MQEPPHARGSANVDLVRGILTASLSLASLHPASTERQKLLRKIKQLKKTLEEAKAQDEDSEKSLLAARVDLAYVLVSETWYLESIAAIWPQPHMLWRPMITPIF